MRFKFTYLPFPANDNEAIKYLYSIYTQLKKIKPVRAKENFHVGRFSYIHAITEMHFALMSNNFIAASSELEKLLHFHYDGKKGFINKGLHISLLQKLKPLFESEAFTNV